jgi:hypothetical protein
MQREWFIYPFSNVDNTIGATGELRPAGPVLILTNIPTHARRNVSAENSSFWAQFNVTDTVLADPRSLWEEDYDKAMKL